MSLKKFLARALADLTGGIGGAESGIGIATAAGLATGGVGFVAVEIGCAIACGAAASAAVDMIEKNAGQITGQKFWPQFYNPVLINYGINPLNPYDYAGARHNEILLNIAQNWSTLSTNNGQSPVRNSIVTFILNYVQNNFGWNDPIYLGVRQSMPNFIYQNVDSLIGVNNYNISN